MLDVQVAVSSGGGVTIRVAGEIDALSAPTLGQAVDAACAVGSRRIVIDLRAVTFLNAPGLRMLRHAQCMADDRGAALELATRPGHVARLVNLVGLDRSPARVDGASCPRSPTAPVATTSSGIGSLVPAPRR